MLPNKKFLQFLLCVGNGSKRLSRKLRNVTKKAQKKYQNLSEDEKNKNGEYARNQYRRLFIKN